MESSYLGKAFKAFDELNEELFDVTDDGIQALDKFYDGDDTDVIAIIDADAEEEEDLKDSYVGKVILECPVCSSMIYKDTDDIHVEEDASELVNVEEECPCCHTVGGFHIIGTVAPYGEEKKEGEEEVEVKETDEITEASDSNNNGIDESIDEIPADDIIDEEAGDDSRGSTYDEVLKFLDEMDYDVADEGVKAYAEEAAEYIDFARAQKDGHYSVRQWYKETQANFPEDLRELKKIVTEGLEQVSVTTDKEHIELNADEDGKVTVSTEPRDEEEPEVIVPVDDEVVDKIETAEEEEEIPEDEDVDIDITDFDEERFDELAEKFLTTNYDNVAGYKTTSGGIDGDKIVLEGVIRYKSGKEVPTKYIFESVDLDENNRLRLVGSNKGLTAHKKPFTMKGFVEGKKLIAESLDYDFESKCAETGKRTHCKGSI